jgi:hypothetical protein
LSQASTAEVLVSRAINTVIRTGSGLLVMARQAPYP